MLVQKLFHLQALNKRLNSLLNIYLLKKDRAFYTEVTHKKGRSY